MLRRGRAGSPASRWPAAARRPTRASRLRPVPQRPGRARPPRTTRGSAPSPTGVRPTSPAAPCPYGCIGHLQGHHRRRRFPDPARHPERLPQLSGRSPPRSPAALSERGLVCVGKVATPSARWARAAEPQPASIPQLSAAGSSTGSAVVGGRRLLRRVGRYRLRRLAALAGGLLRGHGPAADARGPRWLAGVHAVAPSMESVGSGHSHAGRPGLAVARRTGWASRLALRTPATAADRCGCGWRSRSRRASRCTPRSRRCCAAVARGPGGRRARRRRATRWARSGPTRRARGSCSPARRTTASGPLLDDDQPTAGRGHPAAIEAGARRRRRPLRRPAGASATRRGAPGRAADRELRPAGVPLETGLPTPPTARPRRSCRPAGRRATSADHRGRHARLPVLALPVALSSDGAPIGCSCWRARSEALLIDAAVLVVLARPVSRVQEASMTESDGALRDGAGRGGHRRRHRHRPGVAAALRRAGAASSSSAGAATCSSTPRRLGPTSLPVVADVSRARRRRRARRDDRPALRPSRRPRQQRRLPRAGHRGRHRRRCDGARPRCSASTSSAVPHDRRAV